MNSSHKNGRRGYPGGLICTYEVLKGAAIVLALGGHRFSKPRVHLPINSVLQMCLNITLASLGQL